MQIEGMDAGHTDLLGELIEDLLVSGDEQDVKASLTELLREGLSDTGSATGDNFMKVMRQCQILGREDAHQPIFLPWLRRTSATGRHDA